MIIKTTTIPLQSGARTHSLLQQRWFQALLGILCAMVLPGALVLAIWSDNHLLSDTVRNSAFASFGAFALGWLWYRRMIRHPGVQGLENVLSAFIVTFAIAAAVLLLARLEYNRTYIFSAFMLTMMAFALIELRLNSVSLRHFQVVPFGDYERLLRSNGASWTIMRSAAVPREKITGIVADLRADTPDEWQRMMADAVLSGVAVFHIKQIEEALSGRVDIEHMSENQFGSLLPSLGYRKVKSIFDFAVALLLLPLLALPFAMVAIMIKADTPGPAFFRQTRVGSGGRIFRVYKFRTMLHEEASADGQDQRLAAMTATRDARITRVGRFLRRTRIDELPQVLNVLRGEMSWIGPRPEALALSTWYTTELPFYRYRHIVKPGVTGWAQVNQGHVTDLDAVHDKLRLDFYYIKYFSMWLDLLITIRTIRIVIGGSGAK